MVVVMDNLNLHPTDEVRKAIEDNGAKLVFLPTYSPNLSPIEIFWSKVKSILRSIAPRTTEQLIYLAGFTNVMLVPCLSENRYRDFLLEFHHA